MSTSNIAFPNPTSPLAPVGSRCLCLKFSEKICKQKQRPLTFPDQLSRGIVLSMKEQQTHSFFCRPIQRLATFWTFFLLRHLPPSPYLSVFLSFVEYVFFCCRGVVWFSLYLCFSYQSSYLCLQLHYFLFHSRPLLSTGLPVWAKRRWHGRGDDSQNGYIYLSTISSQVAFLHPKIGNCQNISNELHFFFHVKCGTHMKGGRRVRQGQVCI